MKSNNVAQILLYKQGFGEHEYVRFGYTRVT